MDVRSNRCLLEDTSNKISEASTSHCTHVHGINKNYIIYQDQLLVYNLDWKLGLTLYHPIGT